MNHKETLRAIRKITGLKQTEFAVMVGMTPGSLRNIESQGLVMSEERIIAISREIGCGIYLSDNGRVVGLKLTQRDTQKPFTRQWFDAWRLSMPRQLAFRHKLNDMLIQFEKDLVDELQAIDSFSGRDI